MRFNKILMATILFAVIVSLVFVFIPKSEKPLSESMPLEIASKVDDSVYEFKGEQKFIIQTQHKVKSAQDAKVLSDSNYVSLDMDKDELIDIVSDDNVVKVFPDLPVQMFGDYGFGYVHSLGLGGNGVRIAVLDTGYNGDAFLSESLVSDSTNDGNGHGTHVVNTLLSVAPDVTLLIGKVLSDSGYGYTSDLINGIQWAMDNDADVISLSLGSTYVGNAESYLDHPVITKINEAVSMGIIVVVASGNCGVSCNGFTGVTVPAISSDVVSVGAVDSSGSYASFSSYGVVGNVMRPDLLALGVDVCYDDICMSGTSFSTPQVSGAVALLLEAGDFDVLEFGDGNNLVHSRLGLLDLSSLDLSSSVYVSYPSDILVGDSVFFNVSSPDCVLSVGEDSFNDSFSYMFDSVDLYDLSVDCVNYSRTYKIDVKEYIIDSTLQVGTEGEIKFKYKAGEYRFNVTLFELGTTQSHTFENNSFSIPFKPEVSGKHKVIIDVFNSNNNFVDRITEYVYAGNSIVSDFDNIEMMNREG